MSFKNHEEDDSPIPKILIGKRFVVNADISNCFGSIYTHALSWALVGKDIAKKERNGYWHNDIDKYTMNINNGETHGILIGCHASNLLSEINIGCCR
ncbi:RNA-directed DNA polymerase [Neisseria meningitidis]|nr:RNA-directed DNA polymerase [Neisseria meningitidis]